VICFLPDRQDSQGRPHTTYETLRQFTVHGRQPHVARAVRWRIETVDHQTCATRAEELFTARQPTRVCSDGRRRTIVASSAADVPVLR
jgi:hypothetical protein